MTDLFFKSGLKECFEAWFKKRMDAKYLKYVNPYS